jgi:stearoyl-CoA desaturase (delta-9 desaturase)
MAPELSSSSTLVLPRTPAATVSDVTPAPTGGPPAHPSRISLFITVLIVGVPFAAVAGVATRWWGTSVSTLDIVLAAVLYVLTAHGLTIGFHRLLTHKSFRARRPLRLALVALGSMAFEGGPISWVATHRRHHIFADEALDPHSPQGAGGGVLGTMRGLWHAHVGWLFSYGGTDTRRHAPDLLADPDIVMMNALFPVWCLVSLAIPFGLGWAIGGTLSAALGALLWAGVIRIFLLHHITWGVNSLCHMFGSRPFDTKDASHNIAALSVLGMGDSWHNNHHAQPRLANHGLGHQLDSSALLISAFERLGWADDVRWSAAAPVRADIVEVG